MMNIMQLWRMSWRVPRSFKIKTSVVQDFGFCGFWFKFDEVINQKNLTWSEWNGENADGHSLKC